MHCPSIRAIDLFQSLYINGDGLCLIRIHGGHWLDVGSFLFAALHQ